GRPAPIATVNPKQAFARTHLNACEHWLEAVASDSNQWRKPVELRPALRRRAALADTLAGGHGRIPPRRGGAARRSCARRYRTSRSAASVPGRPRTAQPTSRSEERRVGK